MIFDYLADNLINPKILLLNCELKTNKLTAKIGFIAMGLRQGKSFHLVDKRGWNVCEIVLPKDGYRLPTDICLDLTDETFKVITTYV